MWPAIIAAGANLIGGLIQSDAAGEAAGAATAAGEAQAQAIIEGARIAAESNERLTDAGIDAALVGALQARADLGGQVMAGRAGLGYMMGADPSAFGAPPNLLEAYRQDLRADRNPLDQVPTTTATQYTQAQGMPAGFTAPTGTVTQGLQPWHNPQTGETWTAPSGGYSPPSGWVRGAPPQGVQQAGQQAPGSFAFDQATADLDRQIAAARADLSRLEEGEQGDPTWEQGPEVETGQFYEEDGEEFAEMRPGERVETEGEWEYDYGGIDQAERRLRDLEGRRNQASEIATAYDQPISQGATQQRPVSNLLQEAMDAYKPPEQVSLRGEFFDPNVFRAGDEFKQRNVLDYGDLNRRLDYDPAAFRGANYYTTPEEIAASREFDPGAEFTRERTFDPGAEFTRERTFDPGAEFTDEFVYDIEDLERDPGYQFRKREGEGALSNWWTAQGRSDSGAGGKAVARWAQDLASQEYGQAYSRAIAERNARLGIKQAQYAAGTGDIGRRLGIEQAQYAAGTEDIGRRLGIEQARYAAGTEDIGRRTGLGQYEYETQRREDARRQQLQASEYDAYVNESQRLAGLTGQEYASADADLRRRYGVGLDEYNSAIQDQATRYNRAAGIAGIGATAAGSLASQAGQTGAGIMGSYGGAAAAQSNIAQSQANALANIYGNVGAAQSAAATAQGSALGGAFTSGAGNWLAYQDRQRQFEQQEAQNKNIANILKKQPNYNPLF
jgi:hypothetical protein